MNMQGFNQVDIVLGLIVLVFCFLGFTRGAKKQFFSIISFFIATILSIIIPSYIKLDFIQDISPVWGYIILSVLVWIPSYLIFNAIGGFIADKMAKGGVKFIDRIWGIVFGGFKGILVVLLIVFLIGSFPKGIEQLSPAFAGKFNESKVVSTVEPFNPFLKLHIMDNIVVLLNCINDPDYYDLVSSDIGFQNLISQASINDVLNDPEIKQILQKKEYIKFITNKKVQDLIRDQEAMKLLISTDIDKIAVKNI